jgi:hypothetical protein
MVLVFWIVLLAVAVLAVAVLIAAPLCGALMGVWAGWMRSGSAATMTAGMMLGCLTGLAVAVALLVLGATCLLS